MKRQSRVSASAAVVFALLLAACAPGGGPAASPGVAPGGAAATEAPKRGGTFIGAISGDPQGGSRNTSTDLNTFYAFGPVYSALVYVDASREARPDLAESWKISDDEKTYTFKLRKNAKFHDGKPVTSADVKYTIQEVAGKFNAQAQPTFSRIDSIDTPDDHTLIFKLKQPLAVFLNSLSHQFMMVLPKHLYEGTDPKKNPANEKPIGSGPFKFQEWVKGDHLTLVRNDDYFLEGLPYLDRVVFRIIPDAGSRTIAFQKGEVDFLPGQLVAREQTKELSSVQGVQIDDDSGPPGQELLFFNTTKKPLDDVKVRTAIAMAIDQKAIVERAFFSSGAKPSTSHIEKDLGVFHNPNVKLPAFDPAAAGRALDAAGQPKGPDGTRFSLRLAHPTTNDADRRTAELVRDMLSAVGIKVQVLPYDTATLGSTVFVNAEYDMFTASVTSNNDPELGKARHYISATIGTNYGNGSRYKNTEVDRLFAEGSATVGTEKRKDAYWKVQEILAKDMPTFPIVDYNNVDFHRPEIRGFGATPLGFPYFRIVNVWRKG